MNSLQQPEMVRLKGGRFLMGSDRFYPEEAPVREVDVAAFAISCTPVTNRQFVEFIAATGYVTEAERAIDPAAFPDVDPRRLKPGALVFKPLRRAPPAYDWQLWWTYKPGAHWRRPEARKTVQAGRLDHPVVCVSHADASAYAAWAGLRLPTEAEWEYAARGGLSGADYAWGSEVEPNGKPMANIWRGQFPVDPSGAHRVRTTPIGSFPPNAYGLFDMIGNTWEWTADRFDGSVTEEQCCSGGDAKFAMVVKGGSFLCSPDYCARYRPAARQPQAPDTAAVHIGFRCAADVVA